MAKARGAYKFTAGRQASLAKARIISAERRRANGQRAKAVKKTLTDSKAKFTPSVRFTRHSQSVKIEGRTRVIPGTSRRFAGSANLRLESTKQQTITDKGIPTTRIRKGRVTSKLADKTLLNKGIKIPKRGTGRSNAV